MEQDNIFVTRQGTELQLQAVSPVALQNLLFGSGQLQRAIKAGGSINAIKENLSPEAMVALAGNTARLLNYLCAFGITNDPGDYDIEQLRVMGFEVDTPEKARMHWLQILVLDNEDVNKLLVKVIQLTFKQNSETEEAEG